MVLFRIGINIKKNFVYLRKKFDVLEQLFDNPILLQLPMKGMA